VGLQWLSLELHGVISHKTVSFIVRFEVFAAVTMKNAVF
jgi:hypothetical protein